MVSCINKTGANFIKITDNFTDLKKEELSKIDRIKKEINEGKYKIDLQKTAKCIVKNML